MKKIAFMIFFFTLLFSMVAFSFNAYSASSSALDIKKATYDPVSLELLLEGSNIIEAEPHFVIIGETVFQTCGVENSIACCDVYENAIQCHLANSGVEGGGTYAIAVHQGQGATTGSGATNQTANIDTIDVLLPDLPPSFCFLGDVLNCYTGPMDQAGIGECNYGTRQCDSDGKWSYVCEGEGEPSDEVCDGLDNNCDGNVDEDYISEPTSCGEGGCASTGVTSCVDGTVVDSCTPVSPSSDVNCDGLDNDCDGSVDEDYISEPTSCGEGGCASTGVTSCVDGTVVDSCTPGTPAPDDASCDGIDDDCDGSVDEDYTPVETTCGEGGCASTGVTYCWAGNVLDGCDPGSPAPDDASCDGIDDDCDGSVDEDYTPVETTCGVGGCASTGVTSCVNGTVVDSCTPGYASAPEDTDCNGIDDDCDGSVDEDYIPVETTCGVGGCASTGVTYCWAGNVLDACDPGSPAPDDASCNGIDDDCDGSVDEDYISEPTSCGTGVCASTGVTSCVNGTVVDSCTPGYASAPEDTDCNGIDDDCDGSVDEDYIPVETTCGVGGCASTGVTYCWAGNVLDACDPGSPAPDDASCNGIDDDCDGSVDEDFVGTEATCGIGACQREGIYVCLSGIEYLDCEPGIPAPDELTSCNGIDDDCDGMVDEGCVP